MNILFIKFPLSSLIFVADYKYTESRNVNEYGYFFACLLWNASHIQAQIFVQQFIALIWEYSEENKVAKKYGQPQKDQSCFHVRVNSQMGLAENSVDQDYVHGKHK